MRLDDYTDEERHAAVMDERCLVCGGKKELHMPCEECGFSYSRAREFFKKPRQLRLFGEVK